MNGPPPCALTRQAPLSLPTGDTQGTGCCLPSWQHRAQGRGRAGMMARGDSQLSSRPREHLPTTPPTSRREHLGAAGVCLGRPGLTARRSGSSLRPCPLNLLSHRDPLPAFCVRSACHIRLTLRPASCLPSSLSPSPQSKLRTPLRLFLQQRASDQATAPWRLRGLPRELSAGPVRGPSWSCSCLA